jgi:catechol-2,3-dioxygenase
LRIGHIHLRVGDVASAEAFYCGVLDLDVTRRRTGATFLSSGGYHHHLAVNVWRSNGAGIRNGKRAGLDWFAMEINDQPTIRRREKLSRRGRHNNRLNSRRLFRDGPLGHLYPFHHRALNAARRSPHAWRVPIRNRIQSRPTVSVGNE